MRKESANNSEANARGISKKGQSSGTNGTKRESGTLCNMNGYRTMPSGGPVYVHAPERAEQLPNTEEIASRFYTERCGKISGDFRMRFRSPFVRRGCSKHCTGYNREQDDSSFKLTVCTSKKKNKLAYRIKRSKRKLQQFSNQIKKRTKKGVKKIKRIYENIGAKRAMGFDCDLRKCPSTLLECSQSPCAKPNMIFSKFHKLKGKIMKDKEEEAYDTMCRSVTRAEATGHEYKVLKEQSVGTSVDQGTST
ncbi:unnamed protein product [Xylocopa violacea]|uniref:Uncharacterized protein n=1 Tax=Xylocopa violacea TaxID=135666 RepID=A0ABP1P476_XYLVO